VRPSRALDALLAGLVDYAGLFPPAALAMPEAVAAYARYSNGPDRAMLGRFVLPASRLGEFAQCVRDVVHTGAPTLGAPWKLSALASPADAPQIAAFNEAQDGRLVVDSVEAKAETVTAVNAIADALAARYHTYIEIPVREDPTAMVRAIGKRRMRAKLRAGGVIADAFPAPAQVLAFLAVCSRERVPFKATAGLHHPLRGEYALTYDADAPRGTMFGFLNVFLCAALLRAGVDAGAIAPLLEERDAAAIIVLDDAIAWRGHSLPLAALVDARAFFAGSFGSCSFEEPVRDLTSLDLH